MPRRKRIFTKPDRRDPRYDSPVVGHLITKVMQDGKRSLAQRIVYAAIDRANEGTDTVDPLEVITRAVENSKPRVEVKSRRVGGATYQVPLEVDPDRSESLAMRWLVTYARNARAHRCMLRSPTRLKTLPTTKVLPFANATTFTRWHKPTAPSLTSASNFTSSF
jgi:small subunit ribosomal protein S7